MVPFPCPKTVVVMRKSDGAFLTGDAVRQLLKIPKGRGGSSKKRVAVDTAAMPDFSLFVQSTSHNRVLLPNTKLLYSVDPTGKTPPGEEEGVAAGPDTATAPVAGRRGRGKRGGGVARPMTSTAKKSVAKKRSEPTKAAKNDEVEAEAGAPKRKKTSASAGDQGCLLLGRACRGMSPES